MVTRARSKTEGIACCDGDSERLVEVRKAAPQGDLDRLAARFKALSDETRLRILRTISDSPEKICECEIVPTLGLAQPTISYHLKVLREAGLVEPERRGQWVYYQVSQEALLDTVRGLAEMA